MVRVTPQLGWALVCGVGLGLGLWSLVSLLPVLTRPRLLARVAPYVVDVSPGARALLNREAVSPLPVLGVLVPSWVVRSRALLGSVLGDSDTVARRLRQSGSTLTVEAFRSRQLLWGALGAAAGSGLAIVANRTSSLPPLIGVVLVVLLAAAGVAARDALLQRAARLRLQRMTEELPTVLEFLTLSLAAGEGILDALRRVSRVSSGELAREFGSVVTEVAAGLPLADRLRALARGLDLPSLTRAVDQLTGALERGAPIAEVLRAQAQDSRDDAKRRLLETAGKKEVVMLVPLVFLILPTTVAFAIFPGLLVLQVGF